MPDTPDYSWPPPEKRRVIGKRLSRLDGVMKAAGRAKYSYDIQQSGMLFGAILTCPHAHARLSSVDTSAAEKTAGVAAVELMAKPGEEIQFAGYEIAAVAAETEEIAKDAIRKIKADYEVLPHFVNEQDLKNAGTNAKPSGEQVTGDPDQAFKEADVTSEGFYGLPVLNHCALEAHGQVIEWKSDELNYWPSTQNVSGVGSELAKVLEFPPANVHTHMDVIGGAFGSKFSPDRWGEACARLSKKAGGKPVKLFLDRATELIIAGNRPAFYANIKAGAKKDGSLTVWDAKTWGTGGYQGANLPASAFPYVFRKVPNIRFQHTSVAVNAAMERAWRAPNNPQLSYLTFCALEDLAAKLNMDPVEFFTKNADLTTQPKVYTSQLAKAAEMAKWKELWHPRGQGASGPVKRGLGIGFNTWFGLGALANCRTTIHPDGSVELELGSQDLGTGTRTVIAMVAAESLGLPVGGVKVKIGDSKYPEAEASGGSTTVGGVSAATRKSTMNALAKLYEAVAPSLGAQPGDLEAVEGKVRVKGDPAKSLEWQAACQKLGATAIIAMGVNNQRGPGGLISGGVGGVQMADVSVDTETGVVRMNRMIAVQDCGMVVNPKTAESQVYGACIMSICGALMEERIMDSQTGRVLNPDFDYYKLAGIGDVGEIVVYMNTEPEYDKRGVIGLGEPPVIGGLAAIGNAVANAIGVRVPVLPLTPNKVLAALEGEECLMEAFEYASPTTLQQTFGLLGHDWGDARILAGGTDLLDLMKDYIESPKRVVNIKAVKELEGIRKTSAGLRIGALVTLDELSKNADVRTEYPSLAEAARGVASMQTRNMGTVGGDLCQRPRCWYFRLGYSLLAKGKDGQSLVPNGDNRYHAIFGNQGPAYFVSASSFGPPLAALGAKVKLASASGNRELPIEKLFVTPQDDSARETALRPEEILTEILVPLARGAHNATYEIRQKTALDWPLATASVVLKMRGSSVSEARVVLGHVAPMPWRAEAAERVLAGKALTPAVAEEAGKAAAEGAAPLSGNGYKVQLVRTAVKRALLEAGRGKA